MELCLYTDSVAHLSLDAALDLTAEVGATAAEIAAGGQSSAPHMDVFELVDNPAKRKVFLDQLSSRGLRLGAVNCSAWPLHPAQGDHHVRIMKAAVTLAGQIGVTKIVTMSGCPGDGPNAQMINWIFYPWPPEAMALLDRQWDQAIAFWQEFARFSADHGVERIALELHPMHLVYNVPTLLRLREAVGPVIGANVDPSHMFWQQMEPAAIVRALGPAVHHVHLKDVQYHPPQLALAGVLDNRPFDNPSQRAWTFRTVGQGHGPEFWRPFLQALAEVGYDDVLSIENEDPVRPAEEGVREAASFTKALMAGLVG